MTADRVVEVKQTPEGIELTISARLENGDPVALGVVLDISQGRLLAAQLAAAAGDAFYRMGPRPAHALIPAPA